MNPRWGAAAAEAESGPDDFLQRRGNDGDQEDEDDDEEEEEEEKRGNSGKLEVGEAAERERHHRESISHHVRTFIHSWVFFNSFMQNGYFCSSVVH